MRIDYRLRAKGEDWKVYDVLIEGISFITNRRAEVDSMLDRRSLEQLIAQLAERNRQAMEKDEPPMPVEVEGTTDE